MHLLVLSAFRHRDDPHLHGHLYGLNAPFGAQCFPTRPPHPCDGQGPLSQCTFWCSVLSDGKRNASTGKSRRSQCTFWCSVLSDLYGVPIHEGIACLNAPFGAQCFPTLILRSRPSTLRVSMHLLVLSAFRLLVARSSPRRVSRSQCTFWCSVLSDAMTGVSKTTLRRSQCTFWCSVLSDAWRRILKAVVDSRVSMHLLVLSAFRPHTARHVGPPRPSLNAPFGAQCFPTDGDGDRGGDRRPVSMHLLVLSAFRPKWDSVSHAW